jgi:hypothetical protein
MDPEKLRQAWQSQPSGSQIHIDADVLVREVRRNQQSFRATIFWRDFREILAAAFVVVAVSLHVVLKGIEEHWPWLMLGVGAAFVAAYILFDRWRQRPNAPHYDGALISHIEQSLKEVEHQIWLLRNVFWWYLLPCALGGLFPSVYFFATDLATRELQDFLGPFLLSTGIFVAIFYGVYLLNQYAVRRGLEPRRQELLAMRDSLLDTEE